MRSLSPVVRQSSAGSPLVNETARNRTKSFDFGTRSGKIAKFF
ncbi:hypothetical protein CKA32_001866 [Geitlerinema sp. FC II]|nr:hypothetical protein CKA32_001866 [Geitlerinema sp. FC II]